MALTELEHAVSHHRPGSTLHESASTTSATLSVQSPTCPLAALSHSPPHSGLESQAMPKKSQRQAPVHAAALTETLQYPANPESPLYFNTELPYPGPLPLADPARARKPMASPVVLQQTSKNPGIPGPKMPVSDELKNPEIKAEIKSPEIPGPMKQPADELKNPGTSEQKTPADELKNAGVPLPRTPDELKTAGIPPPRTPDEGIPQPRTPNELMIPEPMTPDELKR